MGRVVASGPQLEDWEYCGFKYKQLKGYSTQVVVSKGLAQVISQAPSREHLDWQVSVIVTDIPDVLALITRIRDAMQKLVPGSWYKSAVKIFRPRYTYKLGVQVYVPQVTDFADARLAESVHKEAVRILLDH